MSRHCDLFGASLQQNSEKFTIPPFCCSPSPGRQDNDPQLSADRRSRVRRFLPRLGIEPPGQGGVVQGTQVEAKAATGIQPGENASPKTLKG